MESKYQEARHEEDIRACGHPPRAHLTGLQVCILKAKGRLDPFSTRFFSRWMRKTDLTEKALCDAVLEMIHGLIDADLGGGIIRKRVGIAGKGKRGSARTVLATNKNDRWFFVLS